MEYCKFVTEEDLMGLPRGFRFHPTDEELIVHYVIPKAMNSNFSAAAIGQADFNKCEPWDLPKKANMGDAERYYYFQRDRKYPTGLRTNRATEAGYWKATGKDKEIYTGVGNRRNLVGMKKTLVFYTGRAPKGEKSNWVMHEFRLHPQSNLIPKNDHGWVISRVVHKKTGCDGGGDGMHKKLPCNEDYLFSPIERSNSFSVDELIRDDFESLPPLIEPSPPPPPDISQLQDLKLKAVMPISYALALDQPIDPWHPSSSTTYHDEDQLNYTKNNPSYYHSSFSNKLLFQTSDPYGYEQPKDNIGFMEKYKCKVELQQCATSAAISFSQDTDITFNDMNNGEISSEYDKLLPSTLGSMPDLSDLWNY